MHVQFIAPKASGENEVGLVLEALQVNTDLPGLQGSRELKEIKDPRVFRDPRDLKAHRGLRAIQANLSQPLQFWHLRCPWW